MLGKNGKYVCDRTRPSSQNKVSSSFEHRHRYFDAQHRIRDWQARLLDRKGDEGKSTISTHIYKHRQISWFKYAEVQVALKLEGSNFKVLTSFLKFLSLGSQCTEVGPPWIEILDKHSSSMEKKKKSGQLTQQSTQQGGA